MAADQQYLPAVSGNATSAPLRLRALAAVAAILLAVYQLIAGQAQASEPGDFDYYVLALSWSPTFCAGEAGNHDKQQCAPGRRFAFVVHGLWPQFERGWPEDCDTRERWVPEDTIQAMLDIMPSRQLVIHEWKKHGTCSGLSIADYFDEIRSLFEKVRIPARYLGPNTDLSVTPKQLSDDFVQSNSGLDQSMMAVECGNRTDQGRLAELRLCFGRDGEFRACGANERQQCRAQTLILPRVR